MQQMQLMSWVAAHFETPTWVKLVSAACTHISAPCVRGSFGDARWATLVVHTPQSSHPHFACTGNAVHLLEAYLGGTWITRSWLLCLRANFSVCGFIILLDYKDRVRSKYCIYLKVASTNVDPYILSLLLCLKLVCLTLVRFNWWLRGFLVGNVLHQLKPSEAHCK